MVDIVRKPATEPEQQRQPPADPPEPETAPVPEDQEPTGLPYAKLEKLPSRFLPYPDGAQVYYRGYTFGEIDVFSESQLGVVEMTETVLQGIECKGMDKLDLTLPDYLLAGMLRRVSTLGGLDFTVTLPANPEVGRMRAVRVTKTMQDVKFDELEDVPGLPISIQVRDNVLEFWPLTVRRFLQMARDLGEDQVPSESQTLAYECANREPAEALELIENATGQEIIDINEVQELLDHSVLPVDVGWTQEIATGKGKDRKVEKKEHTEAVDVTNPTALVFPFRGSERTPRSTVSFGNRGRGSS